LPQLTLATASVYLHRFFVRHAMAQNNNKPGLHHYAVAATSLFLATKVEENYRKMRELVVACCRVAQKQPNLVVDEQSKEYWKWRDTILHNEDILLEALCFDLQLEQPYRLLLDFLRFYRVQENKQLRNTSWAFLNDSLVTTMCLQLAPSSIAGSALYLGVKFAGITLPDDESGRPWWDQLGLHLHDIQRGCNLMAEVYENPALPSQGQKDAYTKDDDLSMFDRTRQATATPQPDRSPVGSARSGSQGVKRDRDTAEDPNLGEWGPNMTGRQSEENQSQPSPKKPRRDSRGEDANLPDTTATRKLSAGFGDDRRASESRGTVDEVQKRIDEIIHNSASGSRLPQPNLVRRPSNQPSLPNDPSRRRSLSTSNWNGPPSSYSNGNGDRAPVPYRRDSRDNGVYNDNSGAQEPRQRSTSQVSPAAVPDLPPQVRSPPTQNGGGNGVDQDDAEKVDYGSEEGEV